MGFLTYRTDTNTLAVYDRKAKVGDPKIWWSLTVFIAITSGKHRES